MTLKPPDGGAGSTRASMKTSVTPGSAPTVASFWPLPPTSCIITYTSCAELPATEDGAQEAFMLASRRCFFTVPYSRCCASIAEIAGLR